jgi:hypothetical protein
VVKTLEAEEEENGPAITESSVKYVKNQDILLPSVTSDLIKILSYSQTILKEIIIQMSILLKQKQEIKAVSQRIKMNQTIKSKMMIYYKKIGIQTLGQLIM